MGLLQEQHLTKWPCTSTIHAFIYCLFRLHARQAQKAQLGMYSSSQLSPTSLVTKWLWASLTEAMLCSRCSPKHLCFFDETVLCQMLRQSSQTQQPSVHVCDEQAEGKASMVDLASCTVLSVHASLAEASSRLDAIRLRVNRRS